MPTTSVESKVTVRERLSLKGGAVSSQHDFTADQTIEAGNTRFGKAITISRGKNGRLFYINVAGGGIQPPELDGGFTSRPDAQAAVDSYMATMKD